MSRLFAAIVLCICLVPVAALGFEPMAATIRVSSGALYDYVVIGEDARATEGYDNAYDTISPGNLNQAMGEPFISAVLAHPDWKPAYRELRGDLRPPAKIVQWQVTITSTLAKGTPLTVELQAEGSRLPKGMKLSLRERDRTADLRAGSATVPAPGPEASASFVVSAEQP